MRGSVITQPAKLALITLALILSVLPAPARAEHRVALLIGNSDYRDQTLALPEQDISHVAAALQTQGFRTEQATDLTQQRMYEVLEQFLESAPINGTALVYFTGRFTGPANHPGSTTAGLLGTDGNAISLTELMNWFGLHAATCCNVFLLDPRGESELLPESVTLSPETFDGLFENALPADSLLGLTKRSEGDTHKLVFAADESPTLQAFLEDACVWTRSSRPGSLFPTAPSRAVSPPSEFPGAADPGDEWVSPDGTVFCFCAAKNEMRGFWIGKYEVTRGKWAVPGLFVAGSKKNHPITGQQTAEVIKRLADLTNRARRAGRLPTDWEYALPTPQQWEHAARAAALGDRYFQDDQLALHANFADRSLLDTGQADYLYALATLDDHHAGLAPVGSYLPNAWGIHDIYGNVWELTHQGVLCGGGWISLPEYCRAGVRKPPLKYPSDYVGFRIVLRPIP